MLLHRDARSPKQLAAGIPPSAAANIEALLGALRARGFVTSANEPAAREIRLTAEGRAATLLIHAASKSIEADLLGRMEPGEATALKHLIRRFIVQTDTGVPHPWQSAPDG
jgi:3-hydroxy-9,10-secoandrosta-1,3,5(10)-triene-9,17-dione monooxygenase reductase component